MIVVTWNIRGLNKAHKQKELKNFLLKNKVDILGCIETRLKEPKAHSIINKIAKGWKFHLNYPKAINGRIWLIWRTHLHVHILGTTDQFIHCSVEDTATAVKFHLSVIYTYNTISLRKQLWSDLRGLSIPGQDAWMLSGDFNAVLSTDDRIGSPVTDAEIKDFKELIYDLQLTPIRSKGWRYSWTNKQVYSKIDWAIGNFQWLQQYSHVEADYLNHSISDHTPIFIKFGRQRLLHQKPFRLYYNVWKTLNLVTFFNKFGTKEDKDHQCNKSGINLKS